MKKEKQKKGDKKGLKEGAAKSCSPVVLYRRDSAEYKKITRQLAIFVGSTNVANRVIVND